VSYAQTSYEEIDVKETVEKREALNYRINDLIDAIRMDSWYGKISEETAKYYISELAAIRDVNVIVTNGIAIYGVNEE
jgi:Txe/YoeB family toxin of Txe-Axe toxin-antitoxin module